MRARLSIRLARRRGHLFGRQAAAAKPTPLRSALGLGSVPSTLSPATLNHPVVEGVG